jgi:hypothetical protein
MKKYWYIKLVLLLLPVMIIGQVRPDTLGIRDYYELIGEFHPIAHQALLITQRGELAISEARGAFDPKLVSTFDSKNFGGSDYYDVWDSYLQIPTFLNVDLKAGFEKHSGVFLNPERTVPEDGLYYAGVSIPIGQGLINHPRRIALRRGEITNQQLTTQAVQVLNNLLLDATHIYWNWYERYQKYDITKSNLELIQERFEGIRSSAINGDLAPIDSTEALIQVQQWTNALRKAEVDLFRSKLLLQNFIWTDSLDIDNLVPQLSPGALSEGLDMYLNLATNHPEWQLLQLENADLDLDRRMSQERLKPVLNLDYQVLLGQTNDSEMGDYLANNYKVGVLFEFPVLLRKERAKLKTAKLKLQENELKQDVQFRKISNRIREAFNTTNNLESMIDQQRDMIINYQRLLRGEQMKFDNGESSIFLINSRQNSALEAQMKLIELISEFGKSIGVLKWSGGQFGDELSSGFEM